ncbi:hypothetical protein D3C84_496930 [compost metagenome]
MLEEGLHVGQQLAGMEIVGQAVDHRHPRMCGEFGERAVGEGADHHRIEHARHDDGAIADRLATAELGIARRQEDGLAAELDHAGLEGETGTGGSLLEDHPQHTAFQGLVTHASVAQILQLGASTDQAVQLLGSTVHQGEKMPSAHGYYLSSFATGRVSWPGLAGTKQAGRAVEAARGDNCRGKARSYKEMSLDANRGHGWRGLEGYRYFSCTNFVPIC